MFRTRFWGVRGSIACPNTQYMKYGGNTSCVSVECGNDLIIFDTGTGIRALGNYMLEEKIKRASIMFSHTHWDHINGFPFFRPAYTPGVNLDIFCGNLDQSNSNIFDVLSDQMKNPNFPVPIDIMQAKMSCKDFRAGETFFLKKDIEIKTAALNHPKGATGYRVNYLGNSVCYVTDTEHKIDQPDENILDLIANADLVIYDATYTDEEYPKFAGWGHSTWQEGVRLCKQAGVKKLAIFHHDPAHDDKFLREISNQAKSMWDGSFVAKEGEEIIFEKNKLNDKFDIVFNKFNNLY
jgi:phosphoribosyl 1,2-cyclic phosphodiesterase